MKLKTALKDIPFSKDIENFWNNVLTEKYSEFNKNSLFNSDRYFDNWQTFKKENNVGQLLQKLVKFKGSEKYQYDYEDWHNIDPNNYLSLKMLALFENEGLSLQTLLLKSEPETDYTQGLTIFDFVELYKTLFDSLHAQNKSIDIRLLERFAPIFYETQIYSHNRVDENINTFFTLLKVTPQEAITYQWFSDTLDLFASGEGENHHTLTNNSHLLNYNSQKRIYDYIEQYFPDKKQENEKYYSKLIPSPILKTQRLHQGIIEIDLYQYLFQNQLEQKDIGHLRNICVYAFKIISSEEFLNSIGQDIKVSQANHEEYSDSITLYFSTKTQQSLEKFEKILIDSLESLLGVSHEIKLHWINDDESGTGWFVGNMDSKFIEKHYLYNKLHSETQHKKANPKLKL